MSRRLLALLCFAVPLAACTGNVQRSARVPHPGVPLASGQPMAGTGEFSAGLSNVTDFVKPGVGDPTQAVEVPGTEMRDELRFRLGKRGSAAAIYEHGFASTSQQPDKTQAPVGAGGVDGYGVSLGYAFETSDPAWSIGTTFELMRWSLPYVEYTTCTEEPYCTGDYTIMSHGRANPLTLGIGVTPSYRAGHVTFFGGAFARNHPTTTRKEYDVDIYDDSDDVRSGPFNLLLHAGIEVELEKRLSAMLVVHQDLMADPVRYGPGLGFALTGRWGM